MGRCKLFEGWTFKLSIPAPFDDPALSGPKDYGISQYNGTGRVMKATLHAPLSGLFWRMPNLVLATEAGAATDGLGVVGHQGNTFKIAEYKSAGKTDCVVFNVNTGKFIVGQFPDRLRHTHPVQSGYGWRLRLRYAVCADADLRLRHGVSRLLQHLQAADGCRLARYEGCGRNGAHAL